MERCNNGVLWWPEHHYQDRGNLGGILRAARENLGLERKTVVTVAKKRGFQITEERLEEVESDASGLNTDCFEWLGLTELLYESTDSHSIGFNPWMHLRRVKRALAEKNYQFPMNSVLRRRLVELARRDRIEKQYLENILCRKSQ
jgi:hypothetical protein